MSAPHEQSQPQDWQGGLDPVEAIRERLEAWEGTPLSLTIRQRELILQILTEEIGPISAQRLLQRIELEC